MFVRFGIFCIVLSIVGVSSAGVPLNSSRDLLQPNIIGGVDAPEAYAPHMAALIFGDRLKAIMCGGSIISKKLVLTAAHCIDPFILHDGSLLPSFRIRVGSNQWNAGGVTVGIDTYYNHPEWDTDTIKNDVGILILEQELILSPYIRIIELSYDRVGGGVRSYVTGWGGTGPKIGDTVVNLQPTPDNLQLLYVRTMSPQQCQRAVTIAAAGMPVPPVQADIEICTFHSIGHGMCSGDSGSALVMASSGKQIGIVSWGFPCAVGAPDMFTRIRGMREFVDHVMKKYGVLRHDKQSGQSWISL